MSAQQKRILFIINPISGLGKQGIVERLLPKTLDSTKFRYTIKYSEYAGHSVVLSRLAIDEGYDVVVAVGGDGSNNEVMRGIVGSRVVMGVIPIGSGNGLARHLKIPLKIKKAIAVINEMKTRKIDTATANGTPFINTAGTGFDAHIAECFSRFGVRGGFTYIFISFRELIGYKNRNYELIIEGKTHRINAFGICYANSDQYGIDAIAAPNAKIDDGLIDVTALKKFPLYSLPFLLIRVFFTRSIHKSKFVETFKAKELLVKREFEEAIHLDGDPHRLGKDIEIKINPLSLSIIVP